MVPYVRSITNIGNILYLVASMYNIIFLRQILSSIPGMSAIGMTNSILSIAFTSSLFLLATYCAEN